MKKNNRGVVIGILLLFVLAIGLTGCGNLLDTASSGIPTTSVAQSDIASSLNVVLVANANWYGGSRSISSLIHQGDGTLETSIVVNGDGSTFEPGSGVNDINMLGNRLFVVNSTAGTFETLDLISGAHKEFSLGASNNPFDAVVVSTTEVYVSYYLSNQIVKIDPTVADSANPVQATLTLPAGSELSPYVASNPGYARPYGMCVVGDKLYVALNNIDASYSPAGKGHVAVIDLPTFTLDRVVQGTGENMGNVFYYPNFDSDLLFFVAIGDYGADPGVIDVYSISSGTIVGSWAVGGAPGSFWIDLRGQGYVKDDSSIKLKRMNTVGLTFTGFDAEYNIPANYLGGMLVDDAGYLYVAVATNTSWGAGNQVYVYDTAINNFVGSLTTGSNPSCMALWKP